MEQRTMITSTKPVVGRLGAPGDRCPSGGTAPSAARTGDDHRPWTLPELRTG